MAMQHENLRSMFAHQSFALNPNFISLSKAFPCCLGLRRLIFDHPWEYRFVRVFIDLWNYHLKLSSNTEVGKMISSHAKRNKCWNYSLTSNTNFFTRRYIYNYKQSYNSKIMTFQLHRLLKTSNNKIKTDIQLKFENYDVQPPIKLYRLIKGNILNIEKN